MKIILIALFICSISACSHHTDSGLPEKTYYKSVQVDGEKIFYREAGDPKKLTIVLLHGYPSSSHSYRELIPMLSSSYHVIAPDNLGSGYSAHPSSKNVTYTFDMLSEYTEKLLNQIGVKKYVLYMQDFGAPVGFRLIMKNPDNVLAIVSQNANAYIDGLTEKRQEFFKKAHFDRSKEHTSSLFNWTSPQAIINGQYLRDVPLNRQNEMSPDAWTHDLHFLSSNDERSIQVQLFQDYQTNIDRYPEWQSLLRKKQYPALIIWGKNDAAFIPEGAKAYLKDLPNARLVLLDAGHFAVEERPETIASELRNFMQTLRDKRKY